MICLHAELYYWLCHKGEELGALYLSENLLHMHRLMCMHTPSGERQFGFTWRPSRKCLLNQWRSHHFEYVRIYWMLSGFDILIRLSSLFVRDGWEHCDDGNYVLRDLLSVVLVIWVLFAQEDMTEALNSQWKHLSYVFLMNRTLCVLNCCSPGLAHDVFFLTLNQ